MSRVQRALSFAMLAAGILLVFGGLTNAVGVSTLGVVSSAAAVAALLYSGAVWFGSPGPNASDSTDPIVVFDRSLRVASGALRGLHVSSCFPAPVRADLEAHCRAALAGNRAHFSVAAGEERLDFDAVPVRSPNGEIVYGLLMREERITPAGRAGA